MSKTPTNSMADTSIRAVPPSESMVIVDFSWDEGMNERRCVLIEKEIQGNIADDERRELEVLVARMRAFRRRMAGLPIDEAKSLHRRLLELQASSKNEACELPQSGASVELSRQDSSSINERLADELELLEGWIIEKMNQPPIHGFIVRFLNEYFLRTLPPGWICQSQLPITTERSEPEPDLAILKGSQADFRHRHPAGTDCRLIIEVSDTSLIEKDRAKARIYREAGVREYWIINVTEQQIERFVWDEVNDDAESEILIPATDLALTLEAAVLVVPLSQLFE